ncbi:hypothetical protein CRE_08570 [Caenorhabditis remanei]|uniref:Uncharacterized protein n=1 Tax=Caenorhabditis remanei TaxID=31234 RepID=E3NH02_CAERE|nr:hypothetical protein CRE_08570 [Caenorhabditis remanei]
MSSDVLTPDDALTDPQEQPTQQTSADLKSDRTQEESKKTKKKNISKEESSKPSENSRAQIVEDDIEDSENRFRLDSTQVPLIAESWEDTGKKKEKTENSGGKTSKKGERVLRWKGITVEEVKKKKKLSRVILDNG